VERRFARKPIYTAAPRVVQIATTFVLTLLGWVVFRAPSLRQAGAHYLAMFGAGGEATTRLDVRPLHGVVMAIAAVVVWTFPTTQALVGLARLPVVAALQPGFLLALCHLHWEKYVPFLYFQF
ncbi:MAG TPA: hypothetical protein VEI02_06315, partial [Planctomycetota bacterium]|nr:hypothetical protein [Planctomycetota bacterium]